MGKEKTMWFNVINITTYTICQTLHIVVYGLAIMMLNFNKAKYTFYNACMDEIYFINLKIKNY